MHIDIATAKSRHDRKWRNGKVEWPELVKRLSITHRTHEKLADYLTMTKDRQDAIKDVGGFVGGYLTGGIRKNGQVKHRQLLTLDIDQAAPDFWDNLELTFDSAALVYSTHKHQPESPRLRLVMPLSRPVTEEEYEPLARWVAHVLGQDQFDRTTYQPTRLMYWPSTAKDADFYCKVQDGSWLDPDQILSHYTDWRDASSWPLGSDENDIIGRSIKKAGDPLEKPGIVGAFCRTYSITEAVLMFLGDVYDSTVMEDRWTYKKGSTSGGLVVYDDKFAYSHHGTDPTCGHLCNSFDLVRIHLFGEQDDEQAELPMNKRPSFLAMTKLATEDDSVKQVLGLERLEGSRADFGEPEPGDDSGWLGQLEVNRNGTYKTTINNIVVILVNDSRLKGKFGRDIFADKEIILGPVHWRKVTKADHFFTDKDIVGVRHYLEKVYNIDHKQKTLEAIEVVMGRQAFHPVQDYLTRQKWDGVPRVEELLINYLGAEDSGYVRAVTRKTLAAAVARVMKPGTKFDHVLTLVGAQGAGKSTLISRLGGQWYCENLTTVQGKEAAEQIKGVWILEMGELAGLKKAEMEIIKNFISRQEDSYRPAYAVKKETYPRQCIFIGTTNNGDFLRDATGNRRFWPVPIDREQAELSPHDLTKKEVGQIWAEAVQIWAEGEDLYLTGELEQVATKAQETHSEKDARFEVVQQYLEKKLPANWEELGLYERRAFLQGDELAAEGTAERQTVTVSAIWVECLGGHIKDLVGHNAKPLHDLMRRMPGWKMAAKQGRTGYGRQPVYVREGGIGGIGLA